jgi:DNA polymerase-3 subunit delta
MAEIKSHEFDRFLEKSVAHYRLFVIYGPDRGLVSERARLIAERTDVDLADPFSLIKLDIADLQGNPGRIVDEVNSFGLFGGSKLVWLRGAANEKSVVDCLQYLAEKPPEGSYLVIEAGDLKKGSALRKVAEANRSMATIPCYTDDTRALNTLIDQELQDEGLRISSAARQLLLESLGGDRIASRNELKKLALYCRGLPLIEEEHVADIIGDASAISVDDALDAILNGDRNGFFLATQKIINSKTPIFLVLQGCLRQFQLLDLMKAEMDDKRLPAAQVMQTLGRHIHFRRKPVIEKALRVWSSAAIAREMSRLQATILQSRQKQVIEESVALHTLMGTTLQSDRKG